jgi:outer membrane protein TolC
LETQVRSLHAAVVAATEQAELYSAKVVPAYEAALRSQEKLYAQGKGNVLQVWQTLRLFNEARNEALTLWLGAATARIQLSLLVGEEI